MEKTTWTPKMMLNGVASVVLWLGSVVLGLFDVNVLDSMIFGNLFPSLEKLGRWQTHAIWQYTMVLLVLIWLAMAFLTGDHHVKQFGEPIAWKWFAWVFGIEILILVLAWII